jgi:3-hydroxyacyl-CoA dehydrogenase/enoyl-CoA hydratase/3-hydroxybutyryl-CoA epimerase/enoyl-CoA isomerase
MFQSNSMRVQRLQGGFVELCFDRHGLPINKFDGDTLTDLHGAVAVISANASIRGVLITSGKDGFIAGADIAAFAKMFKRSEGEIRKFCTDANAAMNALEDLPVPTVVAINGFALGGGFELALAADLRVMSRSARVGFPEVKLGLIPGFGGTVRLSRVAGVPTALDWITSGAPADSAKAHACGAVDEIADDASLRAVAMNVLERAAAGEIDWRGKRAKKLNPVVELRPAELRAAHVATIEKIGKMGGIKHQPAYEAAANVIAHGAASTRADALALETGVFAKIAKTQAADSLVQLFLSEQALKKKAKEHAKRARPVREAAVVGAGIMGGGIAYVSAISGVPVRLKDIQQQQLEIGRGEAQKLLQKQVSSGRLDQARADAVRASIRPQLDYQGFESVNIVVEAVVENLKVKHAVLSEVERLVPSDAIVASNTSSLRIDRLGEGMSRPENFIGMHFFNPAPVMPLVEVIRGPKTSPTVVSTVVHYATTMGKTPIVVKDGAGFLVNRILTPYMLAFMQLVGEGVDFARIDRVMEQFGWPMGPAYLNDVIGMDTGTHVFDIVCQGFPERLQRAPQDAVRLMKEQNRLGQKNGVGFYKYEKDPAGKPRKIADPTSYELLAPLQRATAMALTDEEIVERMMLPMIVEAACCLDEGVVESPEELDMALLLGLGLPRYLGGILKYADWLGLANVVAMSDRYAPLGAHYRVPQSLRDRAASGTNYY